MNQELDFYQRQRLGEVITIKEKVKTAIYLGDGLFHVESETMEFDVSMSEKDADYVLNGLHLTRGE